MLKLPNQPLNVTKNICLSRIKGFYPDLYRFLCMAKCALKWPLKALSEGQNQDGGPSAKKRIELN